MTTHQQQTQQVYHMESVGDIQYQRVGETLEANSQQVRQQQDEQQKQQFAAQQFGGYEYADCALDELKPPSQQAEESYEVQQHSQLSHLMQQQQQQRLTTDEGDEDEDEGDSSDCPNDSSHSNRQTMAVDPHVDMMMQPLYHGTVDAKTNIARANNGDLESIQSKQLLLNAAEQYEQPPHDASVTAQSELYKAHMAMQQAVHTQSSFEGYQTDMTNNSAMTTAMKNSRQETYQTEVETPSCSQQQMAPATPPLIEYTEVFVWGENKSGQLGIDSQLQPAPSTTQGGIKVQYRRPDYIPLPRSCSFNIVIKQLACGENHSGILTAQGHLYMMGSNSVGQLGVSTVGTMATTGTPAGLSQTQIEQLYSTGSPILVESLKALTVEQVSCGRDFTAVVCRGAQQSTTPEAASSMVDSQQQPAKAEVYSWGSNLNGQLGCSDVQQSNLPMRLDAFDVLQEEIIQVSCGDSHSLFLTSEHDVISCGNNNQGQCGFDPQECAETSTPFKVAAFDGVQIVQVAAGYEHSLFLSGDGQVFASGSNQDLCIGVGDGFERTQTPVYIEALANQRVVKVDANFSSSCITEQGELFLWGRGVWGDTPFPQQILTISNPVVDVTLGLEVSVAIDNQGMAWSWGKNSHGELGVGDSEKRIHPFPILNMKGKTVSRALCGHNFVICLGSNIKKDLHLAQIQQQASNGAPLDTKKKKTSKRKKNHAEQRKKSNMRPHTSATYTKYVNEQNQVVPAQRKSRQAAAAEHRHHHTFGSMAIGNSRSSSVDRSTSVGGQAARRQSRNISQKKVPSQERTLANLQSKYGNLSMQQQPMQITSMTSHEKSRHTNENMAGPRSPIQGAAGNNKPLVTDYESGKPGIELDIVKSVKTLQSKVKNLKDENRALKQELSSKSSTIEKLEKNVLKLQSDDSHQKQILELTNDIKRNEMKLRKMKERRNHYRSEKDTLKGKVGEMQKDNSALFQQVAQMQESSHSTREENAKLKGKLSKTESELEFVRTDYKAMKAQQDTIFDKNTKVEQELVGKLRWTESQTNDLQSQLKFENDERNKMAKEIARLERLVSSREEYVVSLETEAIMLRKEIKDSKFNNEKQGYDKLIGGLTKIRSSQERSRSHNRGDLSGVSAERQQSNHTNLANQSSMLRPVKQERGYDDQLPQKEFSLGRKTNDYSRYQEPSMQLSSTHTQDARSRLMQQVDLSRHAADISRTSTAIPTMRSLNKPSVISPRHRDLNSTQQKRTPIEVYRDSDDLMRSSYRNKNTGVARNLIPAELPQYAQMPLQQQKNEHHQSSEKKVAFLDEPIVQDKSLARTVLAVVPLEEMKVTLESQTPQATLDSNTLDVEYRPANSAAQNAAMAAVDTTDVVSQLPDNSMVLMQQNSEQPTRPTNDEILTELQKPDAVSASDFKDQHRLTTTIERGDNDQDLLAVRKQPVSEARPIPTVSTMIPLGAPKADNDLQDKYKAMLKAKFDMKTIQRRRGDRSREP